MSQYGKAQYWEERYARDPQPFDWYQRYNGLKQIIQANIEKDHRVLYAGAGNSRLAEQMIQDGYTSIMCIDRSPICVKAMNQKYKQKEELKYLCMDIKAMDFSQGSYDAVIDKATLDSVLCGEGSTSNANKLISEIYRVLAKNGVYIIVSYGQAEYRLGYLQKPEYEWTVRMQQIAKPTIASTISIASQDNQSPNVHYVYICRKGEKPS